MEYYGNNDWRDYLSLKHHGILGMKWGRRNGPPYPLGASDHSASEKKAGWQKSLSDGESASARKKARYVRKESKKVDKYYKKDIKRADKETARAEKKYSKAAEKGSSRAEKLAELYRDKAVDSEALKRVKEKELEQLRNMSLKDIQDEKQKTKEQGKFLKDRISDSDELYQQSRKRRENRQELQKTKSENRVTKDERDQIKEEVRKRVSKETDDGLRDKLRELDQKYYEAHRADNYKEREKYGDMISDLRDDYISKSKDKARAEKEFDRINDEVMSQRTEPQQKKKASSESSEWRIINSDDYSNYNDYIKDFGSRPHISEQTIKQIRKDDVNFDNSIITAVNKASKLVHPTSSDKRIAEDILESLNDWEADGLSERDFDLKKKALRILNS